MLVPVTLLWRVRLSIRKKLALGGIFSITVLIMVFAVVRVIVVSSYSSEPDQSWLYMWSSIEQTVCTSFLSYLIWLIECIQAYTPWLRQLLWLHVSLPSHRCSKNQIVLKISGQELRNYFCSWLRRGHGLVNLSRSYQNFPMTNSPVPPRTILRFLMEQWLALNRS